MSQQTRILGTIPINRGGYRGDSVYYRDNIVLFNGSSYICITDNEHGIIAIPPKGNEQSSSCWGILCEGLSAFDVAVNNGFKGTEKEWLESLKGASLTFESLTEEQKESLRGPAGPPGEVPIVQEKGTLETVVMSQKAVTDEIDAIYNEHYIATDVTQSDGTITSRSFNIDANDKRIRGVVVPQAAQFQVRHQDNADNNRILLSVNDSNKIKEVGVYATEGAAQMGTRYDSSEDNSFYSIIKTDKNEGVVQVSKVDKNKKIELGAIIGAEPSGSYNGAFIQSNEKELSAANFASSDFLGFKILNGEDALLSIQSNSIHSAEKGEVLWENDLQAKIAELGITVTPSSSDSTIFVIDESLEKASTTDGKIHVIPTDRKGGSDIYDEYYYKDGNWELLGTTAINTSLSEYLKSTDAENTYVKKTELSDIQTPMEAYTDEDVEEWFN